jgi:tetratricopeptide (TPR) repeat protein
MERLLKLAEKYVLYTTIFLVPVAFANISPNPYIVVKLVILVTGISLALILWCARVLVSGRLEYRKGAFDFPVLLLAGAYLASAILKTPNKMEAILLPGTATAVVASAFLYFLVNQYEEKRGFVLTLLASGSLFSFVTLLSAFDALQAIPQLPQFVRAAGFTPEGGFLPAVIFLLILLVMGVGNVILDKTVQSRILGGIFSTIIAFGVIASLVNVIPGSKFAPRFPNLATSWSIAIDAIKDSPILGVGPGNYLTAFSRFRPIAYNQSDLWAVKFATATNFYVTAFTETGLLGLAAIILIVFVLYKRMRKDTLFREGKTISVGTLYMSALILLLLLLAIFPATLLITFIFFLMLAFSASTHKTTLHLQTDDVENDTPSQVGSKLPAILVTIPVLIVVAFVFFRGFTIIRAEYQFTDALTALSKNDAQKTFDNLNKAINTNPKVDRYRMTSAQVSILLANAVAQKKDLSDDDRQNISKLIQNAIEQGKAGVALNPLRSTNWDILSQIYRTIMPLAKGADQFALQTGSQAIALDPFNPNLRIAVGGIYYAQGDFDNAIKFFESATQVKSDQANAYYNLAFAYREKGDLSKAETAMSQVLSLITDKSSKDYELAKRALEDIQNKKKETDAQKGQELNPPQKDEPVLDPKIDLPKDAEPPTQEETPKEESPSVTPTTKTTQTVTPELTPTVTP